MGLDFRIKGVKRDFRESPHWSYSGFGDFRKRLAESIGITLEEMKGFSPIGKSWPFSHPVEALLAHSDCDGVLSPYECAQIVEPLREIIRQWDEIDYDRVHGELLAGFMEKCAADFRPLIFC